MLIIVAIRLLVVATITELRKNYLDRVSFSSIANFLECYTTTTVVHFAHSRITYF